MLTFADLIANMNDFNDHAYNRFVEKIKVSPLFVSGRASADVLCLQDAIDPKGILAPGKQGIWPNRFRHLRDTQEPKF